jgi:peptide/nickel transport system substrate-binding protein
MIQQDLKDVGIQLQLTTLEFHTLLDRIYSTYNYEAAILRLADGDADPNSEINVLPSTGSGHFWQLKPISSLPSWQLEINRLMQQQMITINYQQRKQLYDRVQMLVGQNVPVIYLTSPHILVGAKDVVGNFRPAILGNNTLWNAEQVFLRPPRDTAQSR